MKFAATFAALATAVTASVLVERDDAICSYGTTGLQAQMPFVYPLFESCKSALGGDLKNPWGKAPCVAAAVVGSPGIVRDALSCSDASIPQLNELPNLDYGVYAAMVGQCAYDSPACSITNQNFVDFIYNNIGTESPATWPTSSDELVSSYIAPLVEWTATGDSVPYGNFNDWLHYAPDDIVEDCEA